MELPRPDGDIAVVVSSIIVAFFVGVAFFNLANYRALPLYSICLSVIWLLIVFIGLLFIFSEVLEHGIRRIVVVQLAPFSRHHFVEALQLAGHDRIVRFGFSLLKRQFVQLQISKSDVASIEWSAGQATSLAGREMDDWHVFVRYHHKGAKRWTETGYREEASHMVGPSGPRYQAEATGRALIAFLESAGIGFHPSSNECEITAQETKAAR